MKTKNFISLEANYLADTMQSELMKKTVWSNVAIVSYNIPLLATLSICENIMLPLQYFENTKRDEAEKLVKNMLIKYDMDKRMHDKPKIFNEFELLIVKYLRAAIRRPSHIFFFLPHRMLLSNDYLPFIHFIEDVSGFEITVVENFRYFNEYKNLDFKEIPYNSWQSLFSKI